MRNYIIGTFALFLIDQITKAWALIAGLGTAFPSEHALETPVFLSQVTSFWNFVLVRNTGVSFSFFDSFGTQIPLIFLTLLIIGWLINWFKKEKDTINLWAIVLILAGAFGNLIDRIRFNGVIDFIDWHYAGFHWPTFNVADIWITLGAVLYVGWYILQKQK